MCCDASFDSKSLRAACGLVVCSKDGDLLAGAASSFNAVSSMAAEAEAVRQACLLAEGLLLSNITILNDCLSIITLSSTEDVSPWDSQVILSDIHFLARFYNLRFLHEPRTCNRAAYWVAVAKLTNSLPLDWLGSPPPELRASLLSDCNQNFPT